MGSGRSRNIRAYLLRSFIPGSIFRQNSALRKAYSLLVYKITGIAPPKTKSASQERPNKRYTIFDIGTEAAFTELEPIKIECGLSLDQPHSSASVNPRGIVVTTVIDVKSREDLGTEFERVKIESG